VIPIVVTDACELDLPDIGLIEPLDSETGEAVLVDTSSGRLRGTYAAIARRRAAERDGCLRRMDIDGIHVRTGESFVEPLTRFFRAREARR